MNCWQCDTEMEETRETVEYRALPGTELKDVPVHVCPECGERHAEIPHLEDLNRVLAEAVATREGRLRGDEIRFLRKYLDLTGKELASSLGVEPETVSRWENDKGKMNEPTERLLRVLALGDTKAVETFPEQFSNGSRAAYEDAVIDRWVGAQFADGKWTEPERPRR